MPVIKSAKKKLKQDKKRTAQNQIVRDVLKNTLKNARKSKTAKTVQDAVKAIDKAAKQNIIHKNKAARLKSKLSLLLPKSKEKAKPAATPKKSKK